MAGNALGSFFWKLMIRIFACLIGGAIFWTEAHAGDTNLPEVVSEQIEAVKKECKGLISLPTSLVARQKIADNETLGIVLNYDGVECDGVMSYCGTGGCLTQVFASQPDGRFTKVFDQTTRGIEFKRTHSTFELVAFLHGSYCNLSGPDACAKTYVWNGVSFEKIDQQMPEIAGSTLDAEQKLSDNKNPTQVLSLNDEQAVSAIKAMALAGDNRSALLSGAWVALSSVATGIGREKCGLSGEVAKDIWQPALDGLTSQEIQDLNLTITSNFRNAQSRRGLDLNKLFSITKVSVVYLSDGKGSWSCKRIRDVYDRAKIYMKSKSH